MNYLHLRPRVQANFYHVNVEENTRTTLLYFLNSVVVMLVPVDLVYSNYNDTAPNKDI
jgi:hypothetical protein